MKKIKVIMLMIFAASLMSCQKYLETAPRAQADIQTADQLQALIDNITGVVGTQTAYEGTNLTVAYSTDDTEISTELYKNYPTSIPVASLYHYIFDIDNIVSASTDAVWTAEYKRIFTANVILSSVDEVSGDETTKNRVKADAYFIRAYSYWTLANYYCLPYAPGNMQSQGLPLKRTNDYSESLKRATLQETYDFILSDITQAQALVNYADVQPLLRWRVSKPAIDAFLSRFYLFTGDYNKSLQFAGDALNSESARLVDFNTIGAGSTATYTNPAVTLKYAELHDWTAAKFLYWNEFYYARFCYHSSQWFLPGADLIAQYDKDNDLRYQLLMIPNGGRRFGVVSPAQYRYDYFSDGRYLPSGPTVAEVLLNKAEASARTGDIATAMTAVNQLRAGRLKTYVPLTATDKADALKKVLQERRREVPFVFRWLDIRRFSVNDDPSDDVTVTRTFYKVNPGSVDMNTVQTYTLPVKSSRYMVPINGLEITNSRGEIEQNNY